MSDSSSNEEVPFLVKHGPFIKRRRLMAETSPLHTVQKEALEAIIKWFSDPATSNSISVVVMPMGTGKTGIISCLPYMFGSAVHDEAIDIDLSKPMLVIAPGLTILRQLEESLCLNTKNKSPFLMDKKVLKSSDKKKLYRTDIIERTQDIPDLELTVVGRSQVLLSNAQKWRNGKDEIPNYALLRNDLFSAVIVDEAHHLPAEQWQKLLDHFKAYAKVVFFTATPLRHDGREITSDRAISITKDYAYRLERKDAISQRLIREVTFNDTSYEKFGDAELPSYELSILKAVKNKLEEKNKVCPLPGGVKHAAIVITKDIYEAEIVNGICEDLSWSNVKLVHSERHTKRREDLIKDIKSEKYDLLIVVAMLLEGFDHPPLSVAGIMTRIESRVKFAQFVGRIQRLVRNPELEGLGITGDIITAPIFEQRPLFDEYINPKLVRELEEDP